MKISTGIIVSVLFFTRIGSAQEKSYPRNYFRHPLNIPMQLVANFGEIRTNHWHMGLDIRTQQKVNLPVYAAAEGFVSRVVVEPGGFGQAIYIDHPNGYTTLYAHMNAFFPALAKYVVNKQYDLESWKVDLQLPPGLFPLKKGEYIGRSGSTGGSQGPHVHFEIRDTKTGNCLNPLLFRFPIPDGIAPHISRLVMYDRNRSTWEQLPQALALKKTGTHYTVSPVRVGSNRISFAIGATDRFNATPNPNGIYSARILMDGKPVSGFIHDDISYDDTRYMNAQLDYPYKTRRRVDVQHISPLPGMAVAYETSNNDGIVELQDGEKHIILIEVKDASLNTSRIQFTVQYDPSLARAYEVNSREKLVPNHLNIFERENFELFTTERTIYDTVTIDYTESENNDAGAVSPLFRFMSNEIPAHDEFTVRIRPGNIPDEWKNRIVIKNVSGARTYVQRAEWQKDWVSAKFRQFGTFQVYIDTEPPTVNNPSADLSRSSRIVFTPKDNFQVIRKFRVELDGKWLRFTNDKGRNWIYNFDSRFPRGEHEIKAIIEDEAGNVTEKIWKVKR